MAKVSLEYARFLEVKVTGDLDAFFKSNTNLKRYFNMLIEMES